jgi:hypothetical protein
LSPIFKFYALGVIFDVLRALDRFSSFEPRVSFSTIPRALGAVSKLCASELILGSIEGDGSGNHVLRSQAHFWRYQGRYVQFLSFPLQDSFSTILGALSPIFMFSAHRLDFNGTMGVGSNFHVLRSRTRFGRYRRRWVYFFMYFDVYLC